MRTVRTNSVPKEKYGLRKTLASSFIQQLSLSVPAAAEDLGPLVEGGGGGGEHDEVFLLQTQSAHSRCGVEVVRFPNPLDIGNQAGDPVYYCGKHLQLIG